MVVSGKSKVKTQSATKIFLISNFQGGVLKSQNPKCQDLAKFQFFGGRGVDVGGGQGGGVF